jgi:alcohol dehydrogenase class IV
MARSSLADGENSVTTMFENFVLQHPRVRFGFGSIDTLPEELGLLGMHRPLFVTDRGLLASGTFDRVLRALPARPGIAVFSDTPENPTVEGVERALEVYRSEGCDGVVAVGGGSVVDTAKALIVVASLGGPLPKYFGHPELITANVAPLIAIPTTAGTGSEANTGAGIHPTATSRGAGINSPFIVPKVAICDPDLTLTLPRHLTAGTGMDALTHAIEQFLAKGDNAHGDAIALDSIARVFQWVERATENPQDREARWHMMLAAMQAMMPLKGLGPAHALAGTFSDQNLHHGMMVTISMPAVLRMHERRIPERMKKMAEAFPLRAGQSPADAVTEMNKRVGLASSIRQLGYKGGDLNEMSEDAHKSFFNERAPYHPSTDEYRAIIAEALG